MAIIIVRLFFLINYHSQISIIIAKSVSLIKHHFQITICLANFKAFSAQLPLLSLPASLRLGMPVCLVMPSKCRTFWTVLNLINTQPPLWVFQVPLNRRIAGKRDPVHYRSILACAVLLCSRPRSYLWKGNFGHFRRPKTRLLFKTMNKNWPQTCKTYNFPLRHIA